MYLPKRYEGVAFFTANDVNSAFGYRQSLKVLPYVCGVRRPGQILQSDYHTHDGRGDAAIWKNEINKNILYTEHR